MLICNANTLVWKPDLSKCSGVLVPWFLEASRLVGAWYCSQEIVRTQIHHHARQRVLSPARERSHPSSYKQIHTAVRSAPHITPPDGRLDRAHAPQLCHHHHHRLTPALVSHWREHITDTPAASATLPNSSPVDSSSPARTTHPPFHPQRLSKRLQPAFICRLTPQSNAFVCRLPTTAAAAAHRLQPLHLQIFHIRSPSHLSSSLSSSSDSGTTTS